MYILDSNVNFKRLIYKSLGIMENLSGENCRIGSTNINFAIARRPIGLGLCVLK